jgi:hypothetical protein
MIAGIAFWRIVVSAFFTSAAYSGFAPPPNSTGAAAFGGGAGGVSLPQPTSARTSATDAMEAIDRSIFMVSTVRFSRLSKQPFDPRQ